MIASLLRAVMRLARPLRLRWIDYLRACSANEIERLCDMRDGLITRQQIENAHQVKLVERRNRILRGQL